MTRTLLGLTLLVVGVAPARGGLHYSGESFRELPAQWRGYLPDQRLLRGIASPQPLPGLLRDAHADALLKLEAIARTRPLTADEAADLGALYVRHGRPQPALGVLREAVRRHPDHFRLAANLGTAWQLAGDLEQAVAALEEAVRLAPERWKEPERYHLKLVTLRLREGKGAEGLDDLFGIRFVGESGRPEPGALAAGERRKLPANAVAIVQQLGLWLPADGRLLWLLGELANAHGDVRSAANILDGCVTEFALGAAELRARRQLYRAAADDHDKQAEHRPLGTLTFRSPRALARSVDPARLPAVNPSGVNALPWMVIGETELGPRGRPSFLKYVEELDGRRVTVAGHMTPAGNAAAQLTGFLLTENPVGCWFCEVPGPTQILAVELTEGQTTEYTRAPIKVTGTLRLNRTDPERFPFRLTDARVDPAD